MLTEAGARSASAVGLAGLHLWKGSSAKNGEVTRVILSRFPDRKHGCLRFVRKRGEGEQRPLNRGAGRSQPFSDCKLPALLSPPALGERGGPHLDATPSPSSRSSLSAPNVGQLRAPAFPTPSRTIPLGLCQPCSAASRSRHPSADTPRHQRPRAPATTAPSRGTDPPLLTGGCAPRGGARLPQARPLLAFIGRLI